MKHTVLWLPTLLLALILAACRGASEPSWPELVDLGQKYLIELDYEQAILTFTQAIELEPQRGEAYIGRGDAYAALAAGADPAENYQNARADYETGASYLDPSWELVDKLAVVYAAQGDTDALQALLQQAAGTLGSSGELDGLLEKYGYVQDESGTVQKQIQGDELLAELRHWSVGNYWRSNPRPFSYYEQRLRPAVAHLQRLIDAEPERAGEYGAALANVYYMLGEMDNVRETRRWLYELTGEEYYSPEGYIDTREVEGTSPDGDTYTETLETQYNGYGQGIVEIRMNVPWRREYNESGQLTLVETMTVTSYREYNERGQVSFIRTEFSTGGWQELEVLYDAEGRIMQDVYHSHFPDSPGMGTIVEYSYDGDQVHTVDVTTQDDVPQYSSEERTGVLDAYNTVTYSR